MVLLMILSNIVLSSFVCFLFNCQVQGEKEPRVEPALISVFVCLLDSDFIRSKIENSYSGGSGGIVNYIALFSKERTQACKGNKLCI